MNIKNFIKLTDYLWEIPKTYRADMRVPARVYATEKMLSAALNEQAIQQLINVCTLSGIYQYGLAMPDIHQGYGFPIGGVAALDHEEGVISPGGVGYDINCGVRLLVSSYTKTELQEHLVALANQIQRDVPSGVGRGGNLILNNKELDRLLHEGVKWALRHHYADEDDVDRIEEQGCFQGADASFVSDQAKKRGKDQLGTLGAGNHFLEIQEVVDIYHESVAKVFGLFRGQVTFMIHTGSRGLGHQVCTDYVKLMNQVRDKYHIVLPDRELSCVPFRSEEGDCCKLNIN